ncbi:glucose-6-phosphate dehydrogenase [Telmatospirillum sp.]|uniref:glucose-6-phosphate dehydrogenase n=1 Tax=Telmatospirillum sp. TaxID=2079197 RepID=UPI00284C4B6E|nr:glucose-6-phosphate dehydrogenase [Telmatospirillum sp.]MDR3435330.1 glucose-6-phosphate dehydrogenase [Telmatospirillum sp.]
MAEKAVQNGFPEFAAGISGTSPQGRGPTVPPFDYIIFGGTGDLTFRKLLPSLYSTFRDGLVDRSSRIIGASRSALSDEAYRTRVMEALSRHLPKDEMDQDDCRAFLAQISYVELDALGQAGWENLAATLGDSDRVRVFYLATSPDIFGPICRQLKNADLINDKSRVVLEKPIGHDLGTARQINHDVGQVFDEQAIFRIDHYLGKESVQNLLALRFANALFDPLWNSRYIEHIQITVAETVGVEGRGGYYDHAGALRDMVQNHLLQVMCLVAMEPPSQLATEAVRDEKMKVLSSLGPIAREEVLNRTVRGQYSAGAIGGQPVVGYLEEPGITADSDTETFVSLKTEVHNWRWAGMPFYLRTGKRLATKTSEIVVQFRAVPHSIFPGYSSQELLPNKLVIRVQPNEGVHLHMMTKEPGPGGLRLREAVLNLSFSDTFKQRSPDAYERLLLDVVRGAPTLFMRRDEVEAAWKWIEPILDGWQEYNVRPKPYVAGTWGPSASVAMIERDYRSWHDEVDPER